MTPAVCGMDAQVLSKQQNSVLSVGLGWGLGGFPPAAWLRCRLLPLGQEADALARWERGGRRSLGCQGRAAATSSAVAFSAGRAAERASGSGWSRPASATSAEHIGSEDPVLGAQQHRAGTREHLSSGTVPRGVWVLITFTRQTMNSRRIRKCL